MNRAALPAEASRTRPHAATEAAKQFLTTFKTPGMILAAVSGGSDSKGLLLALHEVIAHGGFSAFSLAACTVDHALRASSADEARAVAQFCTERNIPHIVCRWQGEKPATGLQAAAREMRYRLLADAAVQAGARCIVTAHTADDQIETVVMRQSRSEPDAPGLAGMADGVLVERRAWVLRPFLALRRAEIQAYLKGHGQGWLDDPSNTNSRFERVRVRQALGADSHLQVHRITAAGEARLTSSASIDDLLKRHVSVFEDIAARIDPVLAENMADQDCSRAILSLAAVIGGRHHLPGRETAARIAAFLAEASDGRMTAGRVVFDRRRSGLYLYRERRGLPEIVVQPGETKIWDGRVTVANSGSQAWTVSVAGEGLETRARLIAAGLPEAVAKPASRSAAAFTPAMPDPGAHAVAAPRIEACIGLYDTFLPRFDLMMADRIAALFGRDRYLAPPVHDVLTENTG